MFRPLTLIAAASLLSGCGLAETGIAAGAGAAAEAEQAKAALKQLEKVQADIDAAQKTAADARDAALKANEE